MAENQEGTSPDFKRFSEDFSKKLEEITTGIAGLNNKVEEKTSALETKVETIRKKGEEDDNREGLTHYDLEEKKKIENIADRKIEDFKDEIARKESYQRKCIEWDKKAINDFPTIQNPKIEKQVQDYIRTNMTPIGKDSEGNKLYAADAVYNASAIIVAQLHQSGQLEDYPVAENIGLGGFNNRIKGKDANAVQMQISALLGIRPERAKEIYKDFKPGVRRQSEA